MKSLARRRSKARLIRCVVARSDPNLPSKSKISKKYKAADQRGKLALILEEIRRTTVNSYVNEAKNNDDVRARVESMTYTDGISKGKPLTKKDKEKEYFKTGANKLFMVSTAATTKTISRKRADEFTQQPDWWIGGND